MASPLRVGVIGLGPLWHRHYRPALRALRDRFEVAAVCDQVHARAARAARRLGCPAAAGPSDLLQRKEVEALLLLDAQWHGLWAAELACRARKPAFCCPPAGLGAGPVEALRRQAEATAAPVVLALPLRVLPAALALRELVNDRLGPPRLLLASVGAPEDGAECSLLDLLDWSAGLFGGEPVASRRVALESLSCLLLDHGGGREAQLTVCRSPARPHPARLEVVAERGRAVLELPKRLSWSDAAGRHLDRPALTEPVAGALLRQFHQAATGERAASPSLAEVARCLRWAEPGRTENPPAA
jgi:hypothetical protein